MAQTPAMGFGLRPRPILRRGHDVISPSTPRSRADLSAARSQSDAAAPRAAAARLRLALPHLRAGPEIPLRAEPHLHAARRAEGSPVRSAQASRLRARRVRAGVVPRSR